MWFERLTDVTAIVRTEDMLKAALPVLIEELGFEGYAYLSVQPSQTHAISNYHKDWQTLYFERDYAAIDPVVKTAGTTMHAFTWNASSLRANKSTELARFFKEAGDFGIRSGITIPVRTACHHMSMLTLASNKPALCLNRDVDQIAAVTATAFLHAKVAELHAHPTGKLAFELTPKQALCLKWSAEGKSMRAIATIEKMSFGTVNFHLNNVRKTLDAGSLAQATALATKLGLI